MARWRDQATTGVEDLPDELDPHHLDVDRWCPVGPDPTVRRYRAMIAQLEARHAWGADHGVRQDVLVRVTHPSWYGDDTPQEESE